MQIELLVSNLLYELNVNLTMSNCPFWCKCHFILLQENMICLDFNKNYISTKSLFSGWLWRSCPAWRVRNCPPCLTGWMHLWKKFIWEVNYIFERIIYDWWNTFVKESHMTDEKHSWKKNTWQAKYRVFKENVKSKTIVKISIFKQI